MGMFSSLFGSAGSDKADKLRQQALDAFNAVKTPDLSSLQVQLQKAVVAGTITPEQAEAQLLNSNAFNAIKADPNLVGAQKQALQSLQDTASAGGLTAVDKAQLQDITDNQNQENKSSSDAILANARARGMGNTNGTMAARLIAEQGSADRASKSGLGVAALAQARALEALKAAGTQATGMRTQDVGEQTAKASAQNAIDQFNAANKTDINKTNVANNLAAQGANVGNAQHVEDANTGTKNTEILNNANANQTVFNDQLQKANGIAGVNNQWANQAQQTQDKETGADLGLTSGLISAGAGAVNPIAGALSSSASSPVSGDEMAPANYKPKMAANQTASLGYSDGGEVKANGSLEDEYDKFVQNFCNGGTVNMADGGKVKIQPGKKELTPTPSLPIKSSENGKDWTLSDPNNQPIGDFSNYAEAAQFAEKVKQKQPSIKNFLEGGKVEGIAPVPGDSPKNDIVPAKLSPDEVVASRTEAENFQKLTGTPLEEALKRLKNPSPTQTAAVRG